MNRIVTPSFPSLHRLDQFNRIGDSSSRPFDDRDDTFQSRPYSSGLGGVGPGIGQRMTVDELQQQQRQMIAGTGTKHETISSSIRCKRKILNILLLA